MKFAGQRFFVQPAGFGEVMSGFQPVTGDGPLSKMEAQKQAADFQLRNDMAAATADMEIRDRANETAIEIADKRNESDSKAARMNIGMQILGGAFGGDRLAAAQTLASGGGRQPLGVSLGRDVEGINYLTSGLHTARALAANGGSQASAAATGKALEAFPPMPGFTWTK